MNYRTLVIDTQDGKASYGAAYEWTPNQTWLVIGHTNNFRVHPRHARARKAANNLCLKFHKRNHVQLPMAIHEH